MTDDTVGRVLGTARTDAERAVEKALGAITAWSGRHIRYAPVSGGLQNSNWCLTVEGAPSRYFMKIPGAGSEAFIDREVANQAARLADSLGIGPGMVLFDAVSGVEVVEFLEDYRACTTGDLKQPELAHQVIALYRTLHSGERLPLTKTVFDMIDEHLDQVRELGAALPADTDPILAEYAAARSALEATGMDLVPCHNDSKPGNFLIGTGGDALPMKMIDFEFASNNDRAYDLAVLVTEMFFGERQTLELVEAYYGCATRPLTARVQLFIALADLKWGLWGCLQSRLNPGWDFDYRKYGLWKLMRCRMKIADHRWAAWLEAA
ncbi:phosphotransferase [Pseudonocardia yunnanensis]|uniref:Phosphotransferase n=1 Tax=Pseudonocardia yunnanensis TaxID=58107 RepID=A0ABW4F2L6_9PSEU